MESELQTNTISQSELEHLYHHRINQRLKHSAICGHYISSAYTGYKWKGDRIVQFFETVVYKFRTNIFSLKREILPPILTYQFSTHKECMDHHSELVEKIFRDTKKFSVSC